MQKKNILCFGANSFLARAFYDTYKKEHNLIRVYRNNDQEFFLDFEHEKDAGRFTLSLNGLSIDGIIFFQGINPSIGLKDITQDHFMRMTRINLSMPVMVIKALMEQLSRQCTVIFFSSVAKRKGSYDPAYAAAKSALTGLVHSLANACPTVRFNILSLGLVEGSPVHESMTPDFIKKHSEKMFQGRLIKKGNVVRIINELLVNESINRADISLEGGYV